MGLIATYVGARMAMAHRDKRARNQRSRAESKRRIREADGRALEALLNVEMPTTKIRRTLLEQLEVANDPVMRATYYLPAERVQAGDMLHSVEGVVLNATVRETRESAPGVYTLTLDRKPRRIAVADDAPCRVWI